MAWQGIGVAHTFLGIWGEFFADVPIKPGGGTLRVAEALAVPGMS